MSEADDVNPYDAPATVDQETEEPPPLYQCITKAVRGEADPLQYGSQWALSRRAFLKVYDDRMVCGDWTLGFEEQSQARLVGFRAGLLRRKGQLLTIVNAEDTFHFGLIDSEFWHGELPFDVERGTAALSYSGFSIVSRSILVLGFLLLLYSLFAATFH